MSSKALDGSINFQESTYLPIKDMTWGIWLPSRTHISIVHLQCPCRYTDFRLNGFPQPYRRKLNTTDSRPVCLTNKDKGLKETDRLLLSLKR